MLKLSEVVASGAILPALKGKDRDEVIRELVDALVACGAAPASLAAELLDKMIARERVHSTGFGCGVAVPHVKHAGVTTMVAAVGLSQRGVDFSSLDKQPVYTVFLLLSPDDKPEEHLKAMELIFKNLSKETFRRLMRQTQDAAQVRELLAESDAHQLTV